MKKFTVLILIFFNCALLFSQVRPDSAAIVNAVIDESPFIWDRGSSFTLENSLFHDIDFSSYELLSANLSFTDKDQAQKIVLAPFRLTNKPRRFGQLLNTKLNVSLKDKVSTLGIAFGGDNSVPFSRRANRIRVQLFKNLSPAGVPDGTVDPSTNQQVINILKTRLSKDSMLANFITTCLIKDSTGKVMTRPCLADSNLLKSMFAANLDNTSLRILDSLNHEKRLQLIFDRYNKTELARINRVVDSLILVYDKMISRSVLKWTLGYNKQFFPNLFTKGTANDFDSLNYYNSKADNISASFTYSVFNNRVVISATYNQIYQRSAAAKFQKVVPYYGPAFSLSLRLVKFLPQSRLDTSAFYKKSLFVPSLNLGLSFEGKYGDGSKKYEDYYQDKFKKVIVWTPFLDILITPALQFRIAIPVSRNTAVGSEKIIAAGANLQYNFKLSNLSKD